MENLRDRGEHQTIYLGISHPFALLFPRSCRLPTPAADATSHLTTTTWLEALVNVLPFLSCPDTGGVVAQIGSAAPSPSCLDAKLRMLVAKGLSPLPFEPGQFDNRVAPLLARSPEDFCLEPEDFVALQSRLPDGNGILDRPHWWVENLNWAITNAEMPHLDVLAVLISYGGPYFLSSQREPNTPYRAIMDYLFDRLASMDSEFDTIPREFIGARIVKVLQASTWPPEMITPFATVQGAFTDLSERLIFWSPLSNEASKAEIIKSRFLSILSSDRFQVLRIFVGKAQPRQAVEEISRLLRVAAPPSLRAVLGAGTLHHLRLLDYIEIYLKAARAVWDRSSVLSRDFGLQSPLVGVVDFLLAEYESAEAGSALALTHKDIQAVKQAPGQTAQISAPGYAKHLFHDLLDMLQRPDHLALKDNLQNFKDTLVTDFVLIFDTVMGSGCEIFVKFMLEYIQSIPHEPIFRWLAQFRDRYVDWAGLRLCCDPGTDHSAQQITFGLQIKAVLIKNRSAKFDKIDILKDIFNPFRKHVEGMDKPPPVSDSMLVNDGFLLNHYKTLANRLASLIGHQLVTSTRPVTNSICAAVDGLQGFVNEGVALVGMVKTNHDLKALEFLQAVIAEQAARFKSFAGSDDPVTPFPSPFVLDSSPALVLKDEYLLELEALKKAARCQPALMRLDELLKRTEQLEDAHRAAPAAPKRAAPLDAKRKGAQGNQAGTPAKFTKDASDLDPKSIEIGKVGTRLKIVDTATDFGVDGVVVPKADLARAAGCGTEDKCWAICFSRKPWPRKLEYCNAPGLPGHETHDSTKHSFTKTQMLRLRRAVTGH